jgi:hypothetical protein
MRFIELGSLAGTLLMASALACSSKSGSNSGCSDFRGTYSGQLTCSDGSMLASDVTVTQNGCTLTVTDSDGASTWAASGSKATQNVAEGGTSQHCEVTLNGGNQFSQSCTAQSAGQTLTCTGTGTRTGGGSTGAGGSAGLGGGLGTGGSNGLGGSTGIGGANGTGGSGNPQCGLLWSNDATCNGCMVAACCAELGACAPGTNCGALLVCIDANCPNGGAACIQSSCGAEFQAAEAAATALSTCNDSNCASCF